AQLFVACWERRPRLSPSAAGPAPAPRDCVNRSVSLRTGCTLSLSERIPNGFDPASTQARSAAPSDWATDDGFSPSLAWSSTRESILEFRFSNGWLRNFLISAT